MTTGRINQVTGPVAARGARPEARPSPPPPALAAIPGQRAARPRDHVVSTPPHRRFAGSPGRDDRLTTTTPPPPVVSDRSNRSVLPPPALVHTSHPDGPRVGSPSDVEEGDRPTGRTGSEPASETSADQCSPAPRTDAPARGVNQRNAANWRARGPDPPATPRALLRRGEGRPLGTRRRARRAGPSRPCPNLVADSAAAQQRDDATAPRRRRATRTLAAKSTSGKTYARPRRTREIARATVDVSDLASLPPSFLPRESGVGREALAKAFLSTAVSGRPAWLPADGACKAVPRDELASTVPWSTAIHHREEGKFGISRQAASQATVVPPLKRRLFRRTRRNGRARAWPPSH